MTVIRPSSISGITSVTSPSSSDLLSIHTNNTTEVARVTTSGINVTGIVTATSFDGPVSSATGDFSIADKIIHTGDTNTAIRFPSNDTINLETGGSKRLEVTDTATSIHEATDKVVRFTGGIGEIGSVTGFQATNTANSALTSFGIRATDIRFATSASERLRIDSSGRLLVNQTSNYTVYADSKLQISATDSTASFSVSRWSNNGSSPYINLGKSRGGIGSYTVVQSGDRLGQINFVGADGTDLASHAASIAAYVDGTPGSNDMPGRLSFATASDGGAAETERLRIDKEGSIRIMTANGMLKWTASSGNDPFIRSIGSGQQEIEFNTGGSERLRIKENGDVIIGSGGSWSYPKALNVQGASGSIISLYNADTTSYAQDTNSSIEFKLLTGNTGNQTGSCEIRAFKENGTNGNNARGLNFWTGGNGGSPAERLRITSGGTIRQSGGDLVIDNTNNGYGGLRIVDDTGGDYTVNYIAGRNQGATAHVFKRSGRVQNQSPWANSGGDVEIARISRGGIAFNGDTSQNNTLNDYEEGSWTPTPDDLTNSPQYYNRTGSYTKIGNLVYAIGFLQFGGSPAPQFSSTSNSLYVSGLPFPCDAGGGYVGAVGHVTYQSMNWSGGTYNDYGADVKLISAFGSNSKSSFRVDGGNNTIRGTLRKAAWHDKDFIVTWQGVYRTNS